MPKRRNIKQEEERRYPDSPDPIVMAAAASKPFAERFIGCFKLAKEGVKNGQR